MTVHIGIYYLQKWTPWMWTNLCLYAGHPRVPLYFWLISVRKHGMLHGDWQCHSMVVNQMTLRNQTEYQLNANILLEFRSKSVTFLGEVPSLAANPKTIESSSHDIPYLLPLPIANVHLSAKFPHLLNGLQSALKLTYEAYRLTRNKADEVMVFMLSDTDRRHAKEEPYSLPISYYLRSASISTEAVRKAMMEVLRASWRKNINIILSNLKDNWRNW